MIDEQDRAFLRRALALAAQAGRRTAPNPRVGAVLVQGGRTVGEGWHERAGAPHAETLALAQAGPSARGAVLYTSLEPCAHEGRTPPCTEAILRAGVARVVAAIEDPDPRVAGQGVSVLRARGAVVDLAEGDLAAEAERINEDYLVHRSEGRAFAALKIAATLDGSIADRAGASQWITGAAARARGRELRGRYGAILVGAGTVLADDPELLPPEDSRPGPPFLRCVLDGRLAVAPDARLFRRAGEHPVVIYTSPGHPADRRAHLERAGAAVVVLGPAGGPAPPRSVLQDLAGRGVLGVLVEGGGRTHGGFLGAGMADKIFWFIAPRVLGDARARPAVDAGPRRLDQMSEWRVDREERLGEDMLLVLRPRARDMGRPTCSPDS